MTIAKMAGKITLTIEVDANEAEILISALKEAANRTEERNPSEKDLAEILDRLKNEMEQQVG